MSGREHNSHPADSTAAAVVVITLSAGGLVPLRTVIRQLPADIPAAIVIAQHIAQYTWLPQILSSDTRMPVMLATSGQRLEAGTMYVCPAQQHLAINPDATLALSRKEHVEFARPNFDWLLRSAAASFGARTVAVVLSGMRRDGSRGVVEIGRAGGVVIAQEPATCEAPSMPQAAIDTSAVDLVLAPSQVTEALARVLARDVVARELADWEAPFRRRAS